MTSSSVAIRGFALACVVFTAACSSHGANVSSLPQTAQQVHLATPMSLSPGRIKPPPMIQTPIQPASAMSGRTAKGAIQGLGYSQLPGQASGAAAAPDGSLWVLSDQPAGPNKYIWHYSGGAWTNISGLASKITVAPNGNLYVINSLGNAYYYNGTSWTGVGGGCVDITVASDGSFYVISNGGPGPDFGIWHYTTSWSQSPGGGVKLAASWDTNTYTVNGQAINPGGFYVINSIGSIFYTSGNGTFVQFPGAASAIAPSGTGGLFALGYPTNANGNNLFYFDLSNSSWSAQPGAGVSISAAGGNLFIVSASAYIYKTAVTAVGGGSAAASAAFMTQTSSVKVNATISAGITNAVIAAISAAPDQTQYGYTSSVGTSPLTVGSGTSAQSSVRFVKAVPFAGDGTKPARAPAERFTPDDEQLHRLLSRLPRASATDSIRYKSSSTIPSGAGVGATADLWAAVFAIGSSSVKYQAVSSTLEYQTPHGNVWIDNSLLSGANASPAFAGGSLATTVAAIGNDFENAYASDTAHFASPDYPVSAPGAQSTYSVCDASGATIAGQSAPAYIAEPSDGRINLEVLNSANLGSGVGGFFTGTNYVPQGVLNCNTGSTTPKSNEAPMIYLGWFNGSGAAYELQVDLVGGTAHEFQHLINFVNHSILNPNAATSASNALAEDPFVNEGLSMLSQDLAINRMYPSQPFDSDDTLAHAAAYLAAPQNYSITGFIGIDGSTWGGDGMTPRYNCGGGCYGSAYLFQRYMYDRFGADAYSQGMERSGVQGFSNIAANAAGSGETASQLLSDFAMAVATQAQGVTVPVSSPFFFGTLNLTGTYPTHSGSPRVMPGLATIAAPSNAATSSFVVLGGNVYFSVSGIPAAGEPVSVVDTGGGANLVGGLVQH